MKRVRSQSRLLVHRLYRNEMSRADPSSHTLMEQPVAKEHLGWEGMLEPSLGNAEHSYRLPCPTFELK